MRRCRFTGRPGKADTKTDIKGVLGRLPGSPLSADLRRADPGGGEGFGLIEECLRLAGDEPIGVAVARQASTRGEDASLYKAAPARVRP